MRAWWQAAPFALVFLLFFLVPLALVAMVSLWNFNEYELIPAVTLRNYLSAVRGLLAPHRQRRPVRHAQRPT